MLTPASPGLAFGLVSYNSASDLRDSLPHTVRVAAELGCEVLLWDNASADDSVAIAEALGVTVRRSPTNDGFAAGVNGLFALAGSRDLLLLNPDVCLSGAAQVTALRSLLVGRVGVVAPALRNPDGSIQESARQFPTLVGMAGRSSAASRVSVARRAAERYTQRPQGDGPAPVDWAIGAALLISNAANREVGGWDDDFFLYLEDVDFCFRLAKADWVTLYEPRVELAHTHHRASSAGRGSLMTSVARRHHVRSALRFFAKHRSLAPSAPLPDATSPAAPAAPTEPRTSTDRRAAQSRR